MVVNKRNRNMSGFVFPASFLGPLPFLGAGDILLLKDKDEQLTCHRVKQIIESDRIYNG